MKISRIKAYIKRDWGAGDRLFFPFLKILPPFFFDLLDYFLKIFVIVTIVRALLIYYNLI